MFSGHKVSVVVGITNWNTRKNVCGKVCCGSRPLFFRVVFNESSIELFANKRDAFFFKILWVGNSGFLCLFSDKFFSFFGIHVCTIKKVNRVEVNWHWIKFTIVASWNRVDIVVKFGKFSDVVPNAIVFSMEDVRTIFMNLNSSVLIAVRICISSDVITTIDY